MPSINSEKVISGLLIVAVIVSGYILAVDTFLWNVNPINYHAYGLIAFAVADVVLVVLLYVRPRIGQFLSLPWGVLQVAFIVADVVTGLGLPGFTQADAFDFLILGKGNITGYATDVLIVLYALVAVVAMISLIKRRYRAPETESES